MPFPFARRQAGPAAQPWFQRSDVVRLMEAAQRQAIPELMRVFGQDGLYLRPAEALPAVLSGNLLANVHSLYRQGDAWAGSVRCRDTGLPFLSASQSLVYAAFIAESAGSAESLFEEFARVLKPEGVLLLLTLNPWSALRLHWGVRGVKARRPGEWAGRLRRAGLQVERQTGLGPAWFLPEESAPLIESRSGTPHWRMAWLTVARRREAGVTPLRWSAPAIGMAQGVGAR